MDVSRLRRAISICMFLLAVSAPARGAKPGNVLVIVNDNSRASREIGLYYAGKRKIPAKNIAHIKCPAGEWLPDKDYYKLIEQPVRQHLVKTGLKNKVDYLVLTKGVPIGLKCGMCVDSVLMCMDMGLNFKKAVRGMTNPYYDKREHFSHKKYGFYLATRLDGYTVKQAKALVDRAVAARPARGLFLLDLSPGRNTGGYRLMNDNLLRAHGIILRKGCLSFLDETSEFVGNRKHLMGYFSWGSNDGAFDRRKYKGNRFEPGAIAETAVSTSARTFARTNEGQSLIADLIEAGVTGVKGYVSEPTLAAVANPAVLFDRYLSGFNLAESFYMASKYIYWKDLVIGDPLVAPYAGKR